MVRAVVPHSAQELGTLTVVWSTEHNEGELRSSDALSCEVPPLRSPLTPKEGRQNRVSVRAGDGIRTRDVQLGKLAFYP